MCRSIIFCKNNSFSAQSAGFGTADVKNIAQISNIRKRQFIFRAGETGNETGAVHIERKLKPAAYLRKFFQFILCVKSSVFSRMRNIYHSRKNHVLMAVISQKSLHIVFQFPGAELSVMLGQGENLVACKFNGAGFVNTYMACLSSNHALIVFKHRVDYSLVCLSSSHQKINFGFRAAAEIPDFIFGKICVAVRAIAG